MKHLTTQFARYLYEVYPKHEQDIYNKIAPENVDIYFVKYPELKASETITELVNQISILQTAYYNQKIERAELRKRMRFREVSPWLIKFIIPKFEEEKNR